MSKQIITIKTGKEDLKIGDKIFVTGYKLPKKVISICGYNGVRVKSGKNIIVYSAKLYYKIIGEITI